MAEAAKPIDWPGIQAAAITVGIREAARQAASDLPPIEQTRFVERVLKRASRQQWLSKAEQAQSTAITTGPAALSSNVLTGAAILAKVNAERKERTHDKLSRYAEEAAEEAVNAPLKLKVSKSVRDVAAIYGALWPEQQQPGVNINLWGSGSMSAG